MEIKTPVLGESVTEAEIATVNKNINDIVEKDDILFVLETDKVSIDVRSPINGVITKMLVKPGDIIKKNDVLCTLTEQNLENKTQKLHKHTKEENGKITIEETKQRPEIKKMQNENKKIAKHPAQETAQKKKLTQNAQNTKQTQNIQPTQNTKQTQNIQQTQNTKQTQNLKQKPPINNKTLLQNTTNQQQEKEKIVPMTKLRQKIAERLKESQNTAAILTTFSEIDMLAVKNLRIQYKESFEKTHNVKLGFMSFFVKASIKALQEIPTVNSSIENNNIIYKNYYNIGIAVGTKNGLVVPVIKNAHTLSFAKIEKAIVEFTGKAIENTIEIDELQGGTFTISNGGVYGSLLSTPIINPPQSAIIGLHAIQDRPVVINNNITIRPMMYAALSYDHRIIDGKEAITFLKRIKELIEDPQKLLLEI